MTFSCSVSTTLVLPFFVAGLLSILSPTAWKANRKSTEGKGAFKSVQGLPDEVTEETECNKRAADAFLRKLDHQHARTGIAGGSNQRTDQQRTENACIQATVRTARLPRSEATG